MKKSILRVAIVTVLLCNSPLTAPAEEIKPPEKSEAAKLFSGIEGYEAVAIIPKAMVQNGKITGSSDSTCVVIGKSKDPLFTQVPVTLYYDKDLGWFQYYDTKDGWIIMAKDRLITGKTSRVTSSSTSAAKPSAATEAINRRTCATNLKIIDGSVQMWALENKKSPTAKPLLIDILPFLKDRLLPRCPSGGTYSVTTVADSPTCSHPGHHIDAK
ncbi:MAG: hypothetical protein AB1705_03815 [Verrucomicrobiota bacterium]